MKIIDIPDAIVLPKSKERFSLRDMLKIAMEHYEPSGKGFKAWRQAEKIHRVIDSIEDSKTVKLEDADYEIVKNAVDSFGWNPQLAPLFIPFADAIEKAQSA